LKLRSRQRCLYRPHRPLHLLSGEALHQPEISMAQADQALNLVLVQTHPPGIHVCVLNRPTKRNALPQDLIDELLSQLRLADGDEDISCIIITGSGGLFSGRGWTLPSICVGGSCLFDLCCFEQPARISRRSRNSMRKVRTGNDISRICVMGCGVSGSQ
jgi:hypothetical protein